MWNRPPLACGYSTVFEGDIEDTPLETHQRDPIVLRSIVEGRAKPVRFIQFQNRGGFFNGPQKAQLLPFA